MARLNLDRLSKEEKKRILRESIAQLEEEEEDEELRELLAKHKALKKTKESSQTPTAVQQGQPRGRKPVKGNIQKTGSKIEAQANIMPDLVDVDTFVKNQLPDIAGLRNLLHVSEKQVKSSKKKVHKKERRAQTPPESESETDSGSESDSEDEDEMKVQPVKKKAKGGKKSSLYDKAGSSRLISNELFAHAALEDEIGTDRDLKSLSFNLFVAGELEIISDNNISKAERRTRLEVLKMLAYKHEYLSREEILNQYMYFVSKLEKGKIQVGV